MVCEDLKPSQCYPGSMVLRELGDGLWPGVVTQADELIRIPNHRGTMVAFVIFSGRDREG